MKCKVDRDKCTGLGICESLPPDHFEVDDDGDLIQLREDVSAEDLQSVQEAIDGCPTEALSLVEA